MRSRREIFDEVVSCWESAMKFVDGRELRDIDAGAYEWRLEYKEAEETDEINRENERLDELERLCIKDMGKEIEGP